MRRVAFPLEQIRRRRGTLPTSRRVTRCTPRTQGVQSRAKSTMPVFRAARDRREPDDLGVGELERSGLAEEHLGCRRSKGHGPHARGNGSWSRRLL